MADSAVLYGDNDYPTVINDREDILDALEFKSLEDRVMCESIIESMDKDIAELISNDKVANIPFIGCVRRNPIRKVITDNFNNFRIARTHLTKEQYKEHVRCIVNDAKEELKEKEFHKRFINRVRSRNKKKYERYFLTYGKAYAEMYIKAILLMEEVPFNPEVEEAFETIRNNEKC